MIICLRSQIYEIFLVDEWKFIERHRYQFFDHQQRYVFHRFFSLPLNVSYLSMGISSFFSRHFPLILFPSLPHMFLLFTRENILIIRNFSDFFTPPLWISCSPLSAENMQYRLFQIPETHKLIRLFRWS